MEVLVQIRMENDILACQINGRTPRAKQSVGARFQEGGSSFSIRRISDAANTSRVTRVVQRSTEAIAAEEEYIHPPILSACQ